MLDYLRQRVIDLLGPVQVVTLSTCGRAGIQAQVLPCEAHGLHLYVLVPLTSEHLYNLELDPEAVVTTGEWQLRGTARHLLPGEVPRDLAILRSAQSASSAVVDVLGRQLQVGRASGWGFVETIDIVDDVFDNPLPL